ncbi:EVE domain-containing protein [Neomegalonema perideroedes]|uniref:EVE domain-containing protein n=1 Tax=Neomegalonema perideroedes TaxID=217219 RepID=UPI00036AF202|nr:EVE domain-containing protein [Neomegalonema perideroedes]
MTAFWLIKSEPETWSWAEQVARGAVGEPWTGVRNHSAKLNLSAMRSGDLAFFYHSVSEKRIMGLVRVIREAYPDPTAEPGAPWVCVDVAALAEAPRPLTLAEIKADPRLAETALVKLTRLSVQPVKPEEWRIICEALGLDPERLEK